MSRNGSCNRILLVRTDRIGDVVLSLPTAAFIQSRRPQAEIHFLTRPYTAPLAARAPGVASVTVDDGGSVWDLSRRIASLDCQAAILLYPTARLAAALFWARVPLRIGTAYRWYSWLLSRPVPQHRRKSLRHELELNLELADCGLRLGAGQEILSGRWLPRIEVESGQKESLLARLGLSKAEDLVVVHPGSGGSARVWPLANFVRLIDRLAAEGLAVAVTLGPGEEGLRQMMEPLLASNPTWVFGLDLGELAALLSAARLVVSNSTGPLHLATAVGPKALGIFCPVAPCLPRRWGPYGPGHRALLPPVPVCEACRGQRCPHWDCMPAVTVDQVAETALKMLGGDS